MLQLTFLLLAAAPPSVAATGFQATGIDAAVADAWLERFATVMGQGGRVKVTTQRDVQQLLGLERQRQLLGCSDESSSCLAELAGALGVDGVLSGTVVKSGSSYLVTVKILRARDATVWTSASERAASEDALQDFLDATARAFADTVAPGSPPPPAPRAKTSLVRWLPGAGGLALGITGGVLFGLSKADAALLRDMAAGKDVPGDPTAIAQRGKSLETAGVALLAAGVAGLAASAAWLALGESPPVTATVAPTPGGASLLVGGTFP